MKIFDDEFILWLKMIYLKIRYPRAGHYERICYLGGYTKQDVDQWMKENPDESREKYCKEEISYWE